jgi:hypothetical protein
MENLVKSVAGIFAMFLAKIQMLKWAIKGGGQYVRKRKN